METLIAMLQDLTLADLADWAGRKIADRGKGYINKVGKLFRTADGDLAALVSGSRKYATSVHVDEDGEWESLCSCPYDGGPCKHAVAVLLAAADQVKQGKEFPLLGKKDDLYRVLFNNFKDDDEDFEDEDMVRSDSPFGGRGKQKKEPSVQKILAGKTREELLSLCTELALRYPEVAQRIIETDQLAGGKFEAIVRSLRREIRDITAKSAWYDHWQDEGDLPDYTHVREQLQALLDKGQADAVLDLGAELWDGGNSQVEESNDEGETASEIAECMGIVLQAVPQSSLALPEQLLWVIDRQLEDQFSILDSGEKILENTTYSPAHWREVADTLEVRLKAMSRKQSINTYRREELMDHLLVAYDRGGIQEKIIPLLEKEAGICKCYRKLVERLLAKDEREGARQWCIQGFVDTIKDAPGIAAGLQEQLRRMAEEEKRDDLVAAYRAEDFFDRPSCHTYIELHDATKKVSCWPAVRAGVFGYLETGRRPDQAAKDKRAGDWPLPMPEVARPKEQERHRLDQFPNLGVLIDIAILEKRFDDVVSHYHALRKTKRWGWGGTDTAVAKAVAKSHPQVALDIWLAIVERLIAQVKPRAYEEAVEFLRLMHQVYERDNRLADWHELIGRLRVEHKAKRRLQQELDGLVRKR
jgi:uncharacterized Zn finger protein